MGRDFHSTQCLHLSGRSANLENAYAGESNTVRPKRSKEEEFRTMNARMELADFATAAPARAALIALSKSVEDSGLEKMLTEILRIRASPIIRITDQRLRLLRAVSPQRRAQAKCLACKTRPRCRVERREALHRKREGGSRIDRSHGPRHSHIQHRWASATKTTKIQRRNFPKANSHF